MRLAYDEVQLDQLRQEVSLQREAGLRAELLDGDGARHLEEALALTVIGASCFPDDGVIDPPRLLQAARKAAERAGAVFRIGVDVTGLRIEGELPGRVVGVNVASAEGASERIAADTVVVAAGSWSTLVGDLDRLGIDAQAVRPARGQMLELTADASPIARVVDAPGAYLSPREDGRVLVGATVELVGHERAVTAEGLQGLLAGALAAVPALGSARVTGSWCGFRALTADRLPILGAGPSEGLVLATGHFRNGIVLAPLTGEVVADLALGTQPGVDLAPFSVARLLGEHRHPARSV